MKNKLYLIMTTLLICLLLPGCEAKNEISEPTPDFPVAVGEIIVQVKPERIVCLSPSYTEILYELGAGDRIVGRANEAKFPNGIKKTAKAGSVTDPDVDKIIALAPTLVITQTSFSADVLRTLYNSGIQVLKIQTAQSVEGLQPIYKQLALAVYGASEGEAKGETAYKVIPDGIAQIKAKLPKKRFTYIYSINLDDIYVTPDTYESSILSVFGDNYIKNGKRYSAEFGDLKLRPNKVFLSHPYELENARRHRELKSCPAVKKGDVTTFNHELFEARSARAVTAIKLIAKQLYPNIKF